jgi:hypothetical protein
MCFHNKNNDYAPQFLEVASQHARRRSVKTAKALISLTAQHSLGWHNFACLDVLITH